MHSHTADRLTRSGALVLTKPPMVLVQRWGLSLARVGAGGGRELTAGRGQADQQQEGGVVLHPGCCRLWRRLLTGVGGEGVVSQASEPSLAKAGTLHPAKIPCMHDVTEDGLTLTLPDPIQALTNIRCPASA